MKHNLTFFAVLLVATAAQAVETNLWWDLGSLPSVLFVKRHHFGRPFGVGTRAFYKSVVAKPGCGIWLFDPRQRSEREIFHCDCATIMSMSLSFDTACALISMNATMGDENKLQPSSFHIFEVTLRDGTLRQISSGDYHDIDPIYLSDGRIAFVSTRVESYQMCQNAPASALYTMAADGSDQRRIEFGTLSDFSPWQLDNGSILFTRWEYQDKSVFSLQGLWSINPDGTRVALVYGNTVTIPNTKWQAKPIPGTDELLLTMAPHHGKPVGAIGILNRSLGMEDPRALTNITPEIPFTPSTDPNWHPGDRQMDWAFCDPWPVTRDLFFASYGGPENGGPQRYRLILLHRDGRMKPLYEDQGIDCFNPVPVLPRQRPACLPTLRPADSQQGTFTVQDVAIGPLKDLPRGTVKELRVMTTVPKKYNILNRAIVYEYTSGARHDVVDPLIGYGTFYVKYQLGTVPVEEDGSAHFQAPACTELYFQALDKDGKELLRMGSVTQLMPGERQGCVGCHEARRMTMPVPSQQPLAYQRAPSAIRPPPWGAGPVDFVTQVQPVFDRHCVTCHSGPKPKGGIDLSGDKTWFFNMAYDNLVGRHLVTFTYLTPPHEQTGNFKPLTTGSYASRLTALIEGKHSKVDLDSESRRRIYSWIDANVPYYGTYDNTYPGRPGSRFAWLGKNKGCVPILEITRNGKPFTLPVKAPDINLTHPEWSAVLVRNLAKSAGGLAEEDKALFRDTNDPGYRDILEQICASAKGLADQPRTDMPGAKPVPHKVAWGQFQ